MPSITPGLHNLPDLIDKRQLADTFSVSLRTISNWIENSKIPPPLFSVGNRPRWSREQIEAAFLDDNAEESSDA